MSIFKRALPHPEIPPPTQLPGVSAELLRNPEASPKQGRVDLYRALSKVETLPRIRAMRRRRKLRRPPPFSPQARVSVVVRLWKWVRFW